MVFLHVVMLSATLAPVLIGAAQSQKANDYLPISTWHYIVTSSPLNWGTRFLEKLLIVLHYNCTALSLSLDTIPS